MAPKHSDIRASGTRLHNQESTVKELAQSVRESLQDGDVSIIIPTGMPKAEILRQIQAVIGFVKRDF